MRVCKISVTEFNNQQFIKGAVCKAKPEDLKLVSWDWREVTCTYCLKKKPFKNRREKEKK